MDDNDKSKDQRAHLKDGMLILLIKQAFSGKSFMMQLILNHLESQYAPKVRFLSFQQEEFETLCPEGFKIKKSPTVFILENDQLLYRFEGLVSVKELNMALTEKKPEFNNQTA